MAGHCPSVHGLSSHTRTAHAVGHTPHTAVSNHQLISPELPRQWSDKCDVVVLSIWRRRCPKFDMRLHGIQETVDDRISDAQLNPVGPAVLVMDM